MLDRDSLIDFKSEDLWLWGGADGTGTLGQVSNGRFRWLGCIEFAESVLRVTMVRQAVRL